MAAVDMQISQTATTLAVVVLYETREAIEIELHCVHTSLVFSEAFKKLNPVFR